MENYREKGANTMAKRLSDMMILIAGALLFALAINLFMIPNKFGEGGVPGIAIILFYLFEWPLWLVSLILSVVLLVVGFKFLDRTTTIYTIVAVLFNSLFLHLSDSWRIASDEPVINAIFGGVFAGAGIGLIIRVGGTTAGSTILAKIMNKYLNWNISYSLLFLDLIVVCISYFIIGTERLLLTIVMLYIATKVMDFMVEGLHSKKAITIISGEQNRIAEQVNVVMGRGVTVLYGRGYYTDSPKEILYIVIGKQEVNMLKKIVKSIDTDAFVSIHDVRDVFGGSFKDTALQASPRAMYAKKMEQLKQ